MTESSPSGILHGRRVLIVEDEYLIAADLAKSLEELGAEVVGPVPSCEQALALIKQEPRVDAAVLDINLGADRAYPVADALRQARIPFVFASGYDAIVVPSAYADVPRHQKPIDHVGLARSLGARIGERG
jgi:CheY-like chemotaxis protein